VSWCSVAWVAAADLAERRGLSQQAEVRGGNSREELRLAQPHDARDLHHPPEISALDPVSTCKHALCVPPEEGGGRRRSDGGGGRRARSSFFLAP
jgi:hypothetical protein